MSSTPLFSPRRILIIAANTFTQLMRMKVFYFLLVFVLVAIAVNFVELPHTIGPENFGGEELRHLKNPMIGMMKLFALILAIVSTALLIPRDLEDRTLYTILSKPVPRLDYLVGKLMGVLFLVFAGLAIMTLLLDLVLHYRTNVLLKEWMATADTLIESGEWTSHDKNLTRQEILSHGVTWSLQGAILAIFFEAAIIAAVALLVSTFSSSTLFTVVITVLVYFIGRFIADGREYLLNSSGLDENPAAKFASQLLIVIFPDFRPFGASDEVISGQPMSLSTLGVLFRSTALYIGVYIVLSWFVFSDKEI